MRPITHGSTDQSVVIRIVDSTTGLPEEAVEHDTAGIALWYRREGAAKTAITPAALASLDAAHSDGGIEHVDDGYYRLDLPDAAVASGANGVMVGGTVTGMIVVGVYVPLVAYNPYDSVRMGMTALPNAAADAAGGLPISDDGGLDLDNIIELLAHADYGLAKLVRSTTPANTLDISATGEAGLDFNNIKDATGAHTLTNITVPTVTTVGTCTTNTDMVAAAPSAATIADAVWDEAQADHVGVGTFGVLASEIADILVDTGTTLDTLIKDIPTNAELAAAFTEIKGATWAAGTDTLEAIRDRGDAAWVTATGFSTHSANNVRDAILSDSTPFAGANIDAAVSSRSSHDAAAVKTAIEAAGSHLALIKAVTDALTAAAAAKLATSAGTMVTGTVSHDNTAASTTVFYCDDITEATADHFNGRIVIFTSGDLQYQATDITDYELSAGEGKFTVTALTEAPADNVTFIIV